MAYRLAITTMKKYRKSDLYPRRCDITGEGMSEGFVLWDGDFYSSTEDGAIRLLRSHGFEGTLEEAYDAELCYWTEWDGICEDYAYTIDGIEVESDEWEDDDIVEKESVPEDVMGINQFFQKFGRYVVQARDNDPHYGDFLFLPNEVDVVKAFDPAQFQVVGVYGTAIQDVVYTTSPVDFDDNNNKIGYFVLRRP